MRLAFGNKNGNWVRSIWDDASGLPTGRYKMRKEIVEIPH